MMPKTYFVYIMTNKAGGTLYVGVTNNLGLRVEQHKKGVVSGFTKNYHLHILVYYEETESILHAIGREKRLKHWNRSWKIRLIKTENPEWKDLGEEL